MKAKWQKKTRATFFNECLATSDYDTVREYIARARRDKVRTWVDVLKEAKLKTLVNGMLTKSLIIWTLLNTRAPRGS